MTYDEIRQLSKQRKDTSTHPKHMAILKFDRFAIIQSDKTPAILVDLDVADEIAERRWCIDGGGYPLANISGVYIRLHDYVLAKHIEEKPDGYYVDHINQDKLDNRKQNLRIATPHENVCNLPLKRTNKTGVTGVCREKNGAFRAYIRIDGKQQSLGHYKTIEEAIKARMDAETRLGYKTRPATIKDIIEARKAI